MIPGLVIVVEDYTGGDDYHKVGHVIGEHEGRLIIQLHGNDSRIVLHPKKCVKAIVLEELLNDV